MYSIQLLKFDSKGEGREVFVSSYNAVDAAHAVAQYLDKSPQYAERFVDLITSHPACIELVTMDDAEDGYWLIRISKEQYKKDYPHSIR